ncbi:MAG: hypothetical protein ABIH26_02590 [Candidatus Eisenbacteria bacterium]
MSRSGAGASDSGAAAGGARRPRMRCRSVLGALLAGLLLFAAYNAVPRSPGTRIAPAGPGGTVPRAELAGAIPRLTASYLASGVLYAAEDHFIYKQKPEEGSRIEFGQIGRIPKIDPSPGEQVRDFIARLRIFRDFRPNRGPNNLVVLESGTLLVFYDHIYRSTDGGRSFHSVLDFRTEGFSAPFVQGIAVDRNDDVYFGGYDCTARPHPVRLYRGTNDGSEWGVFHEFPSGEIFHVHTVRYDPYRDRLWVCTGDRDEESFLFSIDAKREGLSLLGGGDQGWRIVSIVPTEDFLYWCSDNDDAGSNVYRYDFERGERERIRSIGKPCYYATRLADGTLVFSTTFENKTPYTVRTKPEPTTDLWVSQNGTDWHMVLSLMGRPGKRGWGSRRPQTLLPAGDQDAEFVYATPLHTTEGDFPLRVYRIRWD